MSSDTIRSGRRLGYPAVLLGWLLAACHAFAMAEPAANTPLESAVAPNTSETDDALLRFRDERYVLNAVLRLYRHSNGPRHLDYVWGHDGAASYKAEQFGRVRVQHGSGESLLFKVESQQDKSSYELCYCPLHEATRQCEGRPPFCGAVDTSILAQSGILYLNGPEGAPFSVHHYFRDYIAQRLEISASEGARKIYREVLIEPPDGTPDCSDYPDQDIDRYSCLYLGQESPSPAADQNAAILAALPTKLVQSKENYELIFAEEFDGDPSRGAAGDCEGGLSELDPAKWSFRADWCGSGRPEDVSCENMRGGRYEMQHVEGCSSGINTGGKFSYKYGYIETKYTVGLEDSHQQNMNMVVGDPRRSLRYAAARYSVPIRNYEEMSRFLPMEINVFEYFPERKRELTNYFYNYHPYIYYRDTEPRYASNWTRYCITNPPAGINFWTAEQCADRTSLTVTKGLEWTPRGYRMLVKVEGLHDDFIVISKGNTRLHRRRATSVTAPVTYTAGAVRYTGTDRDPFFEFLEPEDADSVLTRFTIGHMPLRVDFGSWRGFGNHGGEDATTAAKMKIDYVRVFQPRNRYSDMEPVYE